MTLVERLEKGAYTKEGADELIMEALDHIRKLEEQVRDLEFDLQDIHYQNSMNA